MGDGEGGRGFDSPIYRLACHWWGAHGPEADADDLFTMLREAVAAAPVVPDRDSFGRYADDDVYLWGRIESARDFLAERRAAGDELSDDAVSDAPDEDVWTAAAAIEDSKDEAKGHPGPALRQPRPRRRVPPRPGPQPPQDHRRGRVVGTYLAVGILTRNVAGQGGSKSMT